MTEGKEKNEMSFVGISFLFQKRHIHYTEEQSMNWFTYAGSSKMGKLEDGGIA